jgi:hypothetical protein
MNKVFVLLNHKLTDLQKEELTKEIGVSDIVYLPNEILKTWSSVEPTDDLNVNTLKKDICSWIEKESRKNDYVIVQGEFGATFFMVDFCFKNSLIPIYSTSKRIYKEIRNNDGSVSRNHVFKHVCFRKYRRFYE